MKKYFKFDSLLGVLACYLLLVTFVKKWSPMIFES